jgi:anti-sigma regulatory factor (Ser/Thr protein kinase)
MKDAAEKVRALLEELGEAANRDVVEALGISPATSHRLLSAMTTSGVLERQGKGRAARYRLRRVRRRFQLRGLKEDQAWQRVADEISRIRPLAEQEARSLRYAATEVINNAIDHSAGRSVEVFAAFEGGGSTVVTVHDDGVGVFARLCRDFGFPSAHEAIVQLEKGRLTSDPANHSGEGLFFSSKAVARFRLESQEVVWIVDNLIGDSAIGVSSVKKGTRVVLEVVRGRTPRLEEVFRRYTDPKTLQFSRTRSTVKLSALGKALVSRSEAKRVAERLAGFEHAVLDFSGVEVVGQGFCDEIFRVFARAHPGVALEPVGMNEAVAFMIERARAAAKQEAAQQSRGRRPRSREA